MFHQKVWRGSVVHVETKGKTIQVFWEFKWVSRSLPPAVAGPSQILCNPEQLPPFEDTDCYEALINLGNQLCSGDEAVQGILISHLQKELIYASQAAHLTERLTHGLPSISLRAAPGMFKKSMVHKR